MNYIILDMEWNQAFDHTKVVQSPVILHGEVIQIGAVKVDEDFNLVDTLKINIAPKYYKKMNRRVQKITGITNEQLANGEKFPQAIARFKEWCGEEFRFITWGFDDVAMLADNLTLHGLDNSWGSGYINLQLIYRDQVDNERTQWALSDAVERLQIPLDAQVHDAMNDAWFTYEVCRRLDMVKGIANYSEMRSGDREILQREVFRNYTDCRKLHEDAQLNRILCPECEAELEVKPWLYYGGGRRTTIACCAEHGDYLVKMNSKKVSAEHWNVTRTLYAALEKDLESYKRKTEKREAALKRKAEEKDNTDDNNGNV